MFTVKTICTSCHLNFSSSASRHDSRPTFLGEIKGSFYIHYFLHMKILTNCNQIIFYLPEMLNRFEFFKSSTAIYLFSS